MGLRRQPHCAFAACAKPSPGLLTPDLGTISVFGIDVRADPIAAKRLIAWLPDEPLLYDKLTVAEYLEFIAGLWGMNSVQAERNAQELLERVDLWSHRHERCEGFSRGMKQKTALAGALIHEPRPRRAARHAGRRVPEPGGRARTRMTLRAGSALWLLRLVALPIAFALRQQPLPDSVAVLMVTVVWPSYCC
jgi:hypothetical protein